MILYGERTSDTASSMIIDFFNAWTSGAPYRMKTITAIYKKNDQIFNDLSRYPIDAPFRPYYYELTKYAGKYHLDDLFFNADGSIREGAYYFSFAYNDASNRFQIRQSPDEISAQVKERYVPMLYSMVTDMAIEWPAAVSEFYAGSEPLTDEKHILLVFGEASSQTLQFSWLATFELTGASVDATSSAEDIRSRKAVLINAVQGVLFSQLDDVIIDILKAKNQLAHTRELIKDHKHTIKNFGYSGHLFGLKRALQKGQLEEALDSIKYIDKLSFLIACTTDKLYNFDVHPSKLLLKRGDKGKPFEAPYDRYTSILTLIHEATEDFKQELIHIGEGVEESLLNKIRDEDLSHILTILINLYSNARNEGGHSFHFKLRSPDQLEIAFTNRGDIEEEYLEFFLGTRKEINSDGDGLKFITGSLDLLRHIEREAERTNNQITLKLIINGNYGTETKDPADRR